MRLRRHLLRLSSDGQGRVVCGRFKYLKEVFLLLREEKVGPIDNVPCSTGQGVALAGNQRCLAAVQVHEGRFFRGPVIGSSNLGEDEGQESSSSESQATVFRSVERWIRAKLCSQEIGSGLFVGGLCCRAP
jgi:hypothetical protein